MSLRSRSVALLLLVVVGACGDDDGGATTVTTAAGADTTTTTGVTQVPTELRFTFEAVTGVQGKVLVATVFDNAGGIAGTVCLPADSDPFSGSAVVMTSAPDNPCGYDAPFGVLLTADGDFGYFVAAYAPGTQVTEVCAQGEVTVDGPTEVVIAAADLSGANCTS